MSPTDTVTDPGVAEELVVTILTRTTATASDGYLITALSPGDLQVDVLDYARHVAHTHQAPIPLTIVSQANGTEAHAVVDPDGTIYDDPVDEPGDLDDQPAPVTDNSGYDSDGGTEPSPAYSDTGYSDQDHSEADYYDGESNDAPAATDQPSPTEYRDDGYGYAPDYPESYETAPVTDTAPVTEPPAAPRPAPVPRRAARRPAPPPPSPYEAQTQQFPAYTDPEPVPAPTRAAVTAIPIPPTTAAPTRRRGVRELVGPVLRPGAARTATAVVAVAVIAAGGGFYLGSGHGSSGPSRPLDTYSGSGPGDTTSGPGAIFALDYAEYVYPRTVDGVRAVWPSAPADTLGPYLGSLDPKTTHHLDITATDDPLTYNAGLTLTPAGGTPKRFAQRYHLTRTDDGKYRIADVTPTVASDDPITGTDPQAVPPTSAVPTTTAAAQNTCPAETSGQVTTGNGAGGTSGAGVIEKFDYAYYVQRDAGAARAVIDPSVRAQIAPTPGFDSSISSLPAGTTHCLKITDTGRDTRVGRQFTVALTESRPGTTPSLSNQTVYVKGPVITGITSNN